MIKRWQAGDCVRLWGYKTGCLTAMGTPSVFINHRKDKSDKKACLSRQSNQVENDCTVLETPRLWFDK